MNLRRILILFRKEVIQGPKNFMFIFALVVPLALTLVFSLVFGTFFSGKARLGVVDQGSSRLTELTRENQAVSLRTYNSTAELQDAVARGALDIGLVLPPDFDRLLLGTNPARVSFFIWGESQMQHRIIAASAVVHAMRQVIGQTVPVEINEIVLGTASNIPWEQRLLPFIVLMTIMLSGMMIPAASLVSEKTRHTLTALSSSPATLLEIFAAKGLLGTTLSILTGLLILFLNRALGSQPALLLIVLLLGAIFSACLGVLLGALVKDINTLFATVKGLGIFLYAPGFIYMFPELPQWIARIFPTYYIVNPVIEIVQKNAGLADLAPQLAILVGLIVAGMAAVAGITRRTQDAIAAT